MNNAARSASFGLAANCGAVPPRSSHERNFSLCSQDGIFINWPYSRGLDFKACSRRCHRCCLVNCFRTVIPSIRFRDRSRCSKADDWRRRLWKITSFSRHYFHGDAHQQPSEMHLQPAKRLDMLCPYAKSRKFDCNKRYV